MHEFDLIVIGAGSGNTILTPELDDWRVAMVERGEFGGTCLNRGCIPSKMLVYAADVVMQARHAADLGVDVTVDGTRWSDIVDRVFGRIDPIAQGGEDYRVGLDNVSVFKGEARFVEDKIVEVGQVGLTAERIVIAAGARPFVPPIAGLDQVSYHTSDTVMRLPEVPGRLAILGGGYIATEMAHVFEAMGSAVTVITRRDTLLRDEDEDVSRHFTDVVKDRFDVRFDTMVGSCEQMDGELTLELSIAGHPRTEQFDALLVATGRVPNSDQLGLAATSIAVDDDGYVVTDEHLETTVPGVYALGDIRNPDQLKHTANAEARVVAHNLAHPDHPRVVDLWPTPHAVFSYPQVASVGLTGQAVRQAGLPYTAAVRPYSDTAYGWAMEDTTGLCKVIAHAESRQLLGAHIVGPQASTLVQQLIQGMRFGQTVDQMAAEQLYIHPALSEVVEQALLDL